MILRVAKQSLWHRRYLVLLTFIALTISLCLLLSVEHMRKQAKESFYRTVSGVDLIVAARSSQINVLLSTVFRVGGQSNTLSHTSYQQISQDPRVKWAIPIALGDSHQGMAVVGTTNAYFEHYQYANQRPLVLLQGHTFEDDHDVVLGADVAKQLAYKLGDELVLSHGLGKVSFSHHHDHPLRIAGILARTGTPVDQALHVPLDALADMHNSQANEDAQHSEHAITPSALLLGLQSKFAILTLQRELNQSKQEALSAIIPGVALGELWKILAVGESMLMVLSVLVFVAAILGLCTLMLSSIAQRAAEFAVLRAMGASPWFIFCLIELEALLICAAALFVSVLGVWLAVLGLSGWLLSEFGIVVGQNVLTLNTAWLALGVMLCSLVVAALPALKAYSIAR